MIVPKYTVEDLKKLPLRAIVALAVRCARRVEHLAVPRDEHPQHESCRSAVQSGLQLAEDFARGLPCTGCESVLLTIEASRATVQGELVRENAIAAVVQAASAAVTALHAVVLQGEPGEWHLTGPPTRPLARVADLDAGIAALDAFTAAVEASDAVGYADHFIRAAAADHRKLLDLNLGSYPQAGAPIDPSPSGPLGPLWSDQGLGYDGTMRNDQ